MVKFGYGETFSCLTSSCRSHSHAFFGRVQKARLYSCSCSPSFLRLYWTDSVKHRPDGSPSQLPEFNVALGDNGLKSLRDAKSLTNADSPSVAVVDQASSISNVARATQFVWPPTVPQRGNVMLKTGGNWTERFTVYIRY